ncbi:hypothetical protein GT044_37750 [Streptomyces sp. SID335]|uniref:Uncharacterized protein n=2 Tax=Streptomyces TaxID=1883 RepID=A0A5P2BM18_STRVZ|nr:MULTISPECIES: hypothetical protein [unclassified Streptomyces]NEA00762.1 hypothetical protein [Streptomyces sp. SID10116]QES31177.1 hypothetical protein DEJ47_01070 [Streptomyces venezuelae]MYY86931.1 hypothetical protein [Streptomyces sp. SID335]MYZ19586.1 hypothetical protein [Streptomyces sp. SID337]NDZ88621.1 hypothetical protein [Streptomyces sp. SID10115]
MSFKNIFEGGGSEARSAEESAQKVSQNIPGARPEREGVDPELYDGIPEVERDPKIVRETSPEALRIMDGFLSPLFRRTGSAAAEQRATCEDPASTSSMASSAEGETSKKVKAEIKDEDRPGVKAEDLQRMSDEEMEEMRRKNAEAAAKVERTDSTPTEGA